MFAFPRKRRVVTDAWIMSLVCSFRCRYKVAQLVKLTVRFYQANPAHSRGMPPEADLGDWSLNAVSHFLPARNKS